MLARRYSVTIAALAAANRMGIHSELRVDRQLLIPPIQPNVYCWRNITGQANETVADIAGRYKADPERLARVNNLAGAATTVANRTLCIPDIYATGYIAPPTSGGATTYIVQQGDTLLAIANRYGITVMHLQQANGLRNIDYIEIGQPLQIPQ